MQALVVKVFLGNVYKDEQSIKEGEGMGERTQSAPLNPRERYPDYDSICRAKVNHSWRMR